MIKKIKKTGKGLFAIVILGVLCVWFFSSYSIGIKKEQIEATSFGTQQKVLQSSNSSFETTVEKTEHEKTVSHVYTRQCTVKERVEYMHRTCLSIYGNRTKGENEMLTNNIFVDEKHQILLCVPYKSGASSHLNLLARHSDAVLNGKIPATKLKVILNKLVDQSNRRAVGIYNLNSYPYKTRLQKIEHYYKVAVVRHPFVRVLSMYRNKVATFDATTSNWNCSSNYYGKDLTIWLNDKYGKVAANCTFASFVEYLVEHWEKMRRDMHTTPMEKWCNHCHINYDFIVKLETGDSDQKYLVENKMMSTFEGALHLNVALNTSQYQSEKNNFRSVWPDYSEVHVDTLEKFKLLYLNDLALFGYSYEIRESGLETACSVPVQLENGITNKCC